MLGRQALSKLAKPQVRPAVTIKTPCRAARSYSILHTEKGKNILPQRCCNLHEPSQMDTGPKMESSWEAGEGGHGWIPWRRQHFPEGPTCKRGLLLDKDQSCSQKGWGHSKEKWMLLQSCFSQSLPMGTKRKTNSRCYGAAWADIAVTGGSRGWGKRKTKQTTKLTLKERKTDRQRQRTRTRTSMAWQPPCPTDPSSPQSICWYEGSLYPLQGLAWRDAGEKGLVDKHRAGNKRILIWFAQKCLSITQIIIIEKSITAFNTNTTFSDEVIPVRVCGVVI